MSATSSHPTAAPVRTLTWIRPSRGWAFPDLVELWRHRELIYFLIWRDVKVRYKQTVLGASWAIIQPFGSMVVFSLFFGKLARMPSDGLPYPLFAYAALVPWAFFSNGLAQSTASVVGSQNLITKIYFPRLIIPIAAVASGIVDFALAFTVLLGLMIYFGFPPTATALWILPLLILAMITALGAGLWLSALNVKYRDVRQIMGFLTQMWLFATPIVYPSSLLEEPWHTIYGINPMAGVVEGFRWALLETGTAPGGMIIVSTVVALVVLISGAIYFRRMEPTFADVV